MSDEKPTTSEGTSEAAPTEVPTRPADPLPQVVHHSDDGIKVIGPAIDTRTFKLSPDE